MIIKEKYVPPVEYDKKILGPVKHALSERLKDNPAARSRMASQINNIRMNSNSRVETKGRTSHLLGERLSLTENTLTKAANLPLDTVNTVVDSTKGIISKSDIGKTLIKRLEADPTKQSSGQNAKEWATLMGVGTIGTHLPQLATGDISAAALGGLALGNSAKGAIIGPMLTGGKDTLLKSSVIPAGVIAITTPLLNTLGDKLDLGSDIDFTPEARVGAMGAAGAGMWAFRNRKNKNRQYI